MGGFCPVVDAVYTTYNLVDHNLLSVYPEDVQLCLGGVSRGKVCHQQGYYGEHFCTKVGIAACDSLTDVVSKWSPFLINSQDAHMWLSA